MIPDPGLFEAVPAMVAVPVKNEAERIADCLLALSRQAGFTPGVVLLVNDTDDATLEVVADVAASVAMPIAAIAHDFLAGSGSAGAARRLAMAHADRLAPAAVPLLCTDADGRVAPDWLARNMDYLLQGADAVFGRALIDPVEAARIPPGLHEADRLECVYAAKLDEMAHWIDPDPWDPWPRHVEHSGASIAVRRSVYRLVGGMPGMPLGEDRAFAMALQLADARVRHAMDVTVEVSGRILGRAAGGMADTIRRRLVVPDAFLDDTLEPALARLARLRRRRAVRALCRNERVPFGAAWAVEGARHPAQRVAVADLHDETQAADRILLGLQVPAESAFVN